MLGGEFNGKIARYRSADTGAGDTRETSVQQVHERCEMNMQKKCSLSKNRVECRTESRKLTKGKITKIQTFKGLSREN